MQFEEGCRLALEKIGYTQILTDNQNIGYIDCGYDYIFKDKDNKILAIEVKFISRFKRGFLENSIKRLINCGLSNKSFNFRIDKYILMTACQVSDIQEDALLSGMNNVEVWGYNKIIDKLLLDRDNDDIVIKINSAIKASFPLLPNDNNLFLVYPSVGNKKFDEVISQLKSVKLDGQGSKYEKACIEAIDLLFEEKCFSSKLKPQNITNDKLHKFDAIVRINSSAESFWKTASYFFKCLYVIFEFKNYKNPISQKEIYSTEKYLYKNALRTVSIIIARSGYNSNVPEVVQGALREQGKIIIVLSHDELLQLLRDTRDKPEYDPSDFLEQKLDELLMGINR